MQRKINQCVFFFFFNGKVKTTTIQSSLWGNISFAIRPHFPGSQKQCFLRFSELCKGTPRKHCAIPWEKRTMESFLEYWMPCLLLHRLGETVLSSDFPVRSDKQPVSFIILKSMTKVVVLMKWKVNQIIFLEGLRLTISCLHRLKILFLS